MAGGWTTAGSESGLRGAGKSHKDLWLDFTDYSVDSVTEHLFLSCHWRRRWHSRAGYYSSLGYTVGVYFGPAVRCHLAPVPVLVRGNRLPEVDCTSMSDVDNDVEPAFRLYFYSVCITFIIFQCVSLLAAWYPGYWYLHLMTELDKSENLAVLKSPLFLV